MGSHILESLTGTQAENLLPFLVRKLSHDVFLCTFTFILSAATVPVLQGARGNAYYFACPSLPGTGAHGSVYSLDDCFFTPLRDQSSSLSSKM
jgi:hypothetical protein